MTGNRADNMRRLNEDPGFAAARNARARQRFCAHNEQLQRLANIAKRGCDVPGHLEDQWKALKQLKLTNRDAAATLKIAWLADPDDEADARWAIRRACCIADELIDLIETDRNLDPDLAWELIERAQRLKRVLFWNVAHEEGR